MLLCQLRALVLLVLVASAIGQDVSSGDAYDGPPATTEAAAAPPLTSSDDTAIAAAAPAKLLGSNDSTGDSSTPTQQTDLLTEPEGVAHSSVPQPQLADSESESQITDAQQDDAATSPGGAPSSEDDIPVSNVTGLPSLAVHALYYIWFGDNSDGFGYGEWEASALPHYNSRHLRDTLEYGRIYSAPSNTTTAFYPARGCYASSNPAILAAHMQELVTSGIGVAVVSVAGRPGGTRSLSAGRGEAMEATLFSLFEAAHEAGVKIAFQIENYPERSAMNLRGDIEYLLGRFGKLPALYRDEDRGGRPWLYVHDSYRLAAESLAPVFGRTRGSVLSSVPSTSVRGTSFDVVLVGMYYREPGAVEHLLLSGFDGAYTMFASEGVTEGASVTKWARIGAWARSQGLLFIPTTAPGYDDRKRKPWNKRAVRDRAAGAYYSRMWSAAVAAGADAVCINSFNDWTEGSQIEPAAPAESLPAPSRPPAASTNGPPGGQQLYQTYESPDAYLKLTNKLVRDFVMRQRAPAHDEL